MSARLALVLIGGLVSVVVTGVTLAASGYTFIRNFHGMVTNGGVMCMTAQAGVIDSHTGRPIQSGFLCGREKSSVPAPTVVFSPHLLIVRDHNGKLLLTRTYR
jgi:hypothetical protein